MRKKVTFIGAGHVGATAAMRVAELDLADIILIGGIHEGMSAGKALDMAEASPMEKHHSRIAGYTNDYWDVEGSDIIVISSGVARRPGMSRNDLLSTNKEIVRVIVEKAAELAPEAIVIMVTNPLDAMCHVALEVSGFPKHRVIGMAGVLDSARFATFIAMELKVSVENICAFVLGGHGDTMVPLPRYTCVAGVPVTELMSTQQLEAIVDRTRNGGSEIVGLLKTGSAYYAPACAVKEMVEAILKDKRKIMPCSVYLEGEYGINGLFVGVPVKLGCRGVEEIVQVGLTEQEQEDLEKSADSVRKMVNVLNGINLRSTGKHGTGKKKEVPVFKEKTKKTSAVLRG
ncbi:MAG TPA: malate dehydrogenase [Deltaproteobacteria bacterium]|nr:malate dehydrogenase [Deltaproteobacteria bacterium]